MGFLNGFEKLINEHGSAKILKERIALANDKYASLESKLVESEAKNKKLESENKTLQLDFNQTKEEVRNLKEKLSHFSTSQEYFEEFGALFKRRPNGEWDYTPYCPSCKTAMVSPGRHELFVCGWSVESFPQFTLIQDKVIG